MDIGVAVTVLHLLKVVIELRGHVDVPVLGQLSDWLEKMGVFALSGLHGHRSQQVFLPGVSSRRSRQHTADFSDLWAQCETCSSCPEQP